VRVGLNQKVNQMKTVKVYHYDWMIRDEDSIEYRFNPNSQFATLAWEAGNFIHVADVNVNGVNVDAMLEQAFHDTNTINCPWIENSNVTPMKGPQRSTSVGDIMELDGDKYLVMDIGFMYMEK